MREPWVHAGRLWTNGEPFLAIDAALRGAWHGYSDDEYEQIVTLGWQVTSVPVGTGRALLVGADGVVRDDSWMEAFESQAGLTAIVQASGPDYRPALARALAYPAADNQDGDELTVLSGEIAIFSSQPTAPDRIPDPGPRHSPGRYRPFRASPRAKRTRAS